jgi:hypothetical protein
MPPPTRSAQAIARHLVAGRDRRAVACTPRTAWAYPAPAHSLAWRQSHGERLRCSGRPPSGCCTDRRCEGHQVPGRLILWRSLVSPHPHPARSVSCPCSVFEPGIPGIPGIDRRNPWYDWLCQSPDMTKVHPGCWGYPRFSGESRAPVFHLDGGRPQLTPPSVPPHFWREGAPRRTPIGRRILAIVCTTAGPHECPALGWRCSLVGCWVGSASPDRSHLVKLAGRRDQASGGGSER